MEALWSVLRMYAVGGKMLNGIKSMYFNSLVCVGINMGIRHGYITYPWVFNVYMDAVMKEVKTGMGRMGVRSMKEGKEWR